MSTCNGCGLDTYQWLVDNRDNYKTVAEAEEALSFLGDETGCPCGHGSTTNAKKLNQIVPITETKTYAAERPIKEICTLCGTPRNCVNSKLCRDLSEDDNWVEHTKEVVVCEAWDEPLYNKDDSYKFDENGNMTPVPAGSLIDTIHHPRRTNTEIEYFENTETGERIYVEVSSCTHPKFKEDYVSTNGKPCCTECGIYQPSTNELYQ